ncbi:MAG: GIY-YIG nuclease family protein [Parachlamydiaceae bacterium]|nr:GIY-YIG nuclease family protein [Parachlamydiaceae bacterium]
MVATWEVYIIQTVSGKLYTGITNNFERRFDNHVTRKKGARFFNFSEPLKVVFREPHPNRSEASIRESAIKKMTRKEKLELISST